jgi:hypothetical protein
MGSGTAGAASGSAFVGVMSAEFVQKHEAGDEDSERDPEMEIRGDHAKETAGDRSGDREFRQFSNLD